jgi:pyrroline-5-carboxylate reductase
MDNKTNIAILGSGNLGTSIANGLMIANLFPLKQITLTRRKIELLDQFKKSGFNISSDNRGAVKVSDIILIAVEPQQIDILLEEIADVLNPERHCIISVVSGVTIKQIRKKIGESIPVVRAMPNTAIAIRESMTCIATEGVNEEAIEAARIIFDTVGKTLIIEEELMGAATALGACGIAFFLRAMRAASQGGIEIGFHADKALLIAAQTAKGAASLLLQNQQHPEYEIDKVTTPRGITISGLNQMEHEGFSSAMIRGIVTSAEKAAKLYVEKEGK